MLSQHTAVFEARQFNDLYLEIQNSLPLDSDLINRTPSFSIQSLLDKPYAQFFHSVIVR